MATSIDPLPTRAELLDRVTESVWDIIVIGGGATGLGTAVDAASRGYRTLLFEARDFACATSSRSTKLIHGGVRYLRQGNIPLVRDSLYERGLLLRNAPDLVYPLEFVIPTAGWMQTAYYSAGLKVYDLLAGRLGIQWSRSLNRVDMVNRFPTLNRDLCNSGVAYCDAGFDDARLALALMRTVFQHGGIAVNAMPVDELLKTDGRVSGVVAHDAETGREFSITARAVVNAAGIFCDRIRSLDRSQAPPLLTYSQGSHIVVDREFLPGESAIIIPETEDGRVLFFIPWHGSVLIGTTDIPVPGPNWEPRPQSEEIDYLLDYARRYLSRPIDRGNIRSAFAGLRPLVRSDSASSTAQISRDHKIEVSEDGLITITGGKWTTYRRMAQDAVDRAICVGGLERRACRTADLKIEPTGASAETAVEFSPSRIDDFVRGEQARTVEDILARRTRLLFLDARRAIQIAPEVGDRLATALGRDTDWAAEQIRTFTESASGYLADWGVRRDR